MQDKQFDHIISSKLSGYVSQESPDWGAFLEKKKIAEAATIVPAFDLAIKASLEEYKTTSQPQWAAFLAFQDTFIKTEAAFDESVKASIEGYEVTTDPQWAAYKAYATTHATSALNTEFDAQIRQELEGYTDSSQPDWNAFLDKKFDHEIEANLASHRAVSPPQWDKFKKKGKDDTVIADAQFDKSVMGRLGDKVARYNSEHWLLLRARLHKIAYLRKQIFSYKALEMIFVSLLLFTLGNHFHLLGPTPTTEALIVLNERDDLKSEAIEINKKEQAAAISPEAHKKTELVYNATPSILESETSRPTSVNKTKQSVVKASTPPATANTSYLPLANNQASLVPVINDGEYRDPFDPLIAQNDRTTTEPLALLSSLSTAGLDGYSRPPFASPAPSLFSHENESYSDKSSWLHLFGARDLHHIHTPELIEAELVSASQLVAGYSAELLYSRKVNSRIEIETGFGYSTVSYAPQDNGILEYNGEIRLREVEFLSSSFDFIHLPVSAKFHFVANDNWSVFAGAGISNEFILRSSYEIVDAPTNLFIPMQFPKPELEFPFLYENGFTTGLISERPDLPDFVPYRTKSNNFILKGTLNIGVERQLTSHLAAYLRTTYYHTLYNSEIGPYNNRMDKYNFGLGVKLRLK